VPTSHQIIGWIINIFSSPFHLYPHLNPKPSYAWLPTHLFHKLWVWRWGEGKHYLYLYEYSIYQIFNINCCMEKKLQIGTKSNWVQYELWKDVCCGPNHSCLFFLNHSKIETTIYVQTQTIYFIFTLNNGSIPVINIWTLWIG
jgi:hypothetical protein